MHVSYCRFLSRCVQAGSFGEVGCATKSDIVDYPGCTVDVRLIKGATKRKLGNKTLTIL